MDVRPVDPRDTTIEIDFPTYRVFFWSRMPVPMGVDPTQAGLRCDSYEVSGARSVHEVLEWGERESNGRYFTAYVVLNEALIHLNGLEPTDPRFEGDV